MKKKLASRLLTALLCAAVVITLTPVSGNTYVYGDDGAQVSVQSEELDAAQRALDEAQTALNQAEQNVQTCQAEYDSANQAYTSAVTLAEQKAQAKTTAAAALEQAETAAANSVSALTAAQTELTDATAALQSAEQAVNEKSAAAQTAQSELASAQQAEQTAKGQWEQAKADAQEALEAAQEGEKTVGMRFLNEKAGSDLTAAKTKSWLKTNMAGKTAGSISWSSFMETDDFEDAFYSPYSYENLMRSADLIAEGNVLRKSQDPTLPDLKISYSIMPISIMSNGLSSHVVAHVLMRDNDFKSSAIYASGGRAGWENISWGANDPFMGWYYEEKIHFIADQSGKNQANVTLAMIEQIEGEATANKHDFAAYYKMYYGSKNNYLTNLNQERVDQAYSTGHYTNLINSGHTATGLSTNSKGSIYYGVCHVQNFSQSNLSGTVTPAKFKEELAAFAEDDEQAVANAQAAVDALESEPDYYQQAKATLQAKTQAATDANAELALAETAKTQAASRKAAADTGLADAQQANSQAIQNKEAAQNAYNQVSDEADTAESAVTPLKTAADGKKDALEQAKEVRDAAKQARDQAQAAYNDLYNQENPGGGTSGGDTPGGGTVIYDSDEGPGSGSQAFGPG